MDAQNFTLVPMASMTIRIKLFLELVSSQGFGFGKIVQCVLSLQSRQESKGDNSKHAYVKTFQSLLNAMSAGVQFSMPKILVIFVSMAICLK